MLNHPLHVLRNPAAAAGGPPWNSTCDMIERAIKLKNALELYPEHFRGGDEEPVAEDVLTSDDWTELADILALLKPLKQTSLFVQGDGAHINKQGIHHGSLYENLQAIDFLLA